MGLPGSSGPARQGHEDQPRDRAQPEQRQHREDGRDPHQRRDGVRYQRARVGAACVTLRRATLLHCVTRRECLSALGVSSETHSSLVRPISLARTSSKSRRRQRHPTSIRPLGLSVRRKIRPPKQGSNRRATDPLCIPLAPAPLHRSETSVSASPCCGRRDGSPDRARERAAVALATHRSDARRVAARRLLGAHRYRCSVRGLATRCPARRRTSVR